MSDKTTRDGSDLRWRLGDAELRFIQELRGRLEVNSSVLEALIHYRSLGWSLILRDAANGAALEVDLSQPSHTWSEELLNLAFHQRQVRLAVKTGGGLFAAEVQEAQQLPEDQAELWEGASVAFTDSGRRRYFFRYPPGQPLLPRRDGLIRIYAAGEEVPLPPSLDPATQEPWEWLEPPWEREPANPGPALLKLLYAPRGGTPASPPPLDIPPWKTIFPLIVWHTGILQAMLAPPDDVEAYYRLILRRALAAGFTNSDLLAGLLWHAPLGGWNRGPQDLERLQALVAEGRRRFAAPPPGRPAPRVPSLRPLCHQLAAVTATLRTLRRIAQHDSHLLGSDPPGGEESPEPSAVSSPDGRSTGARSEQPERMCQTRPPNSAADPEKMARLDYLRCYIKGHPGCSHVNDRQRFLAALRLAAEFLRRKERSAASP